MLHDNQRGVDVALSPLQKAMKSLSIWLVMLTLLWQQTHQNPPNKAVCDGGKHESQTISMSLVLRQLLHTSIHFPSP